MQKRKGGRVALALSDSFFIQVDDVTVGIEDDGMDVSGANADGRLSALCRQVPSAVHKPASPPHWRRTRTFLMAHLHSPGCIASNPKENRSAMLEKRNWLCSFRYEVRGN